MQACRSACRQAFGKVAQALLQVQGQLRIVAGVCRYDDLKSAQENIDLQTTLLSRFDLIFIVKDERNPDKDMMIARCASS